MGGDEMNRDPIGSLEDRIERIRLAQQLIDVDYGTQEAIAEGVILLDVDPDHVPLLKADPHKWGQGLVHQIDEERDQTLCGKSPGGCPGARFWGSPNQITCRTCLRSIESRTRAEAARQNYAEQEREWQRQREDENRRWWEAYNAYLAGPDWRAKRAKVMRRANETCEGCGERPAAQVHHLRYPRGSWPGSSEWIAQEKLFDLRAICVECHADVHPARASPA
jgi:hypothetical protein